MGVFPVPDSGESRKCVRYSYDLDVHGDNIEDFLCDYFSG